MQDFATDVFRAPSVSEIARLFSRAIEGLGFSASACRICSPGIGQTQPQGVFKNWPYNWEIESEKLNLERRSPTLQAAHSRSVPFTWSEAFGSSTASRDAVKIYNLARDWGWSDGFVVAIHGPTGLEGVVTMASTESSIHLGPIERAILQAYSVISFEACRRLAPPLSHSRATTDLTVRELDCLRWAAEGKTDWEIGNILHISATTVKFHMDRARSKLGVNNRIHAVAMAIRRGII